MLQRSRHRSGDPQQFAKLMRRLHRHDWVVYAKPAFGGPMQVLRYLGRYTHRVAISNHRLLASIKNASPFAGRITPRGKQGTMTLVATEFLRRFFLHVLPRASYASVTLDSSPIAFVLPLASIPTSAVEQLLHASRSWTLQSFGGGSSVWHCPRCGATMIVVQRFTAADLSTCSYFDSS